MSLEDKSVKKHRFRFELKTPAAFGRHKFREAPCARKTFTGRVRAFLPGPRRFTVYSGVLAVLLLLLAFLGKQGQEELLFDEGSRADIYAYVQAGEEPKIDPADFYPEAEGLDLSLFEYDLGGVDLEEPGEYRTPIYYNGRKTNATLCVRVESGAGEKETNAKESGAAESGAAGESGTEGAAEEEPVLPEDEERETQAKFQSEIREGIE